MDTAPEPPVATRAAPAAPDGPTPRWPWALAAALLAFAGASAGWFARPPVYRCTALVTCPAGGSAVMQAEVARSRAVAESAVTTKPWADLWRSAAPAEVDRFRAGLTVEPAHGAGVRLTFADPAPRVAAGGLAAAHEAFVRHAADLAEVDSNARRNDLTARSVTSTAVRASLDAARRDLAARFGAADFAPLEAALAAEAARLESAYLDQGGAPADLPPWPAPAPAATAPAAPATRPAPGPNRLLDRLRQVRQRQRDAADARVRFESMARQMDERAAENTAALRELRDLEARTAAARPVTLLLDASTPPRPAHDPRPRNAALGAAAGLVVGAIARPAIRWARSAIRRRRTRPGRAFPVITWHRPGHPAPAPTHPADAPAAAP